MSKEKRDRTIQLLAVNPKYKERTLYLSAIYDSKSKQYDLGLSEETLSDKGKIMKALGISDDPEKGVQIDQIQIPVSHREQLDLSNNEDYGKYCLCLANSDLIARNSRTVDSRKHLFFINDVESESVESLTEEMLIFDAKKKIFDESDIDRLKSLCIYLGGIDIRGLSVKALTVKAVKEAELRPESILSFYDGKEDNRVFVLELAHYGIIRSVQGKFFDGETFMGTLDEAVIYVVSPKNSSHVNSLGNRLTEKKKG